MASAIDITKPVYGNPTTQSVRDNFSTASNEISVLQSDVSNKVSKLGDVMDGFLTLYGDPQLALHAANRSWVINQIRSTANAIIYVGDYDAAADLVLTSGQSSIIVGQPLPAATSGNAQMYFTVKVGKAAPSIGNQPPGGVPVGSWLISNGTSWNIYQPAAAGVIAQTVPVNPEIAGLPGGTVYAALQSVPTYYLPLVGGTVTGALNLTQTPTLPGHAATKGYVDSTGVTSFNTRTGAITLTTADVTAVVDASYVNTAGDTMTGQLVLAADPATPMQAATRQYVDTNYYTRTFSDTRYVNTTGDTMTGALSSIAFQAFTGTTWNGSWLGVGATVNDYWQLTCDTSPALLIRAVGGGVAQPGVAIGFNGSIYSPSTITTPSNISCAVVLASSGLFQVAPNYYMQRGGDGSWRFVEGGTTNLTIGVDGNITARAGFYGTAVQSSGNVYATNDMNCAQLYCRSALGINYQALGSHWIGFQWDGQNVPVYVNGGFSGSVLVSHIWTAAQYATRRNEYAVGWDYNAGWYHGGNDTATWFYCAVAYTACDERLKDDIRPSEVNALSILRTIPISQWTVKSEVIGWLHSGSYRGEERQRILDNAKPEYVPIGINAQSLQKILPDCVFVADQSKPIEGKPEGSPLPDDMLQVKREDLVVYLLRGIQQLADEVDELKRSIH